MLLQRAAAKAFTFTRPAAQASDDASLWAMLGLGKSRSGPVVSHANSMGIVAVYSATSLISETIASLPVHITKPDANGNKNRSRPTQYRALWDRPNPWQTRAALYSTAVLSLLLWGNFYAGLEWDAGGGLVAIWPLNPDRVGVDVKPSGDVDFTIVGLGEFTNTATTATPPIWWIQGLTMPGSAKGLSPIEQAMEQIGLSKAIEQAAAGFYGNGMQPAGQIKVPSKLTNDAAKEMAGRMRETAGGAGKAGKWIVMDQGSELAPITIPPQQAQFIEQQRWTAQQVASLFRVPPHLIGDVQRSSSWGTGIEEQTIGFVTFTLNPWIRRIELSAAQHFLRESGYELEIMTQGLMRGSTENRYAAYSIALQNGIKTVNEVRRLEGDPDVEGGDDIHTAANLYGGDAPNTAGNVDSSAAQVDPAAEVQALALNGSQISSLVEILQLVTAGQLSGDSAAALIAISFPSVPSEQIRAMISSAESFTPVPAEAA